MLQIRIFEHKYIVKRLKDINVNQTFIREIQKSESLKNSYLYIKVEMNKEFDYEKSGRIPVLCLSNGQITTWSENSEVIIMDAEIDSTPKIYE